QLPHGGAMRRLLFFLFAACSHDDHPAALEVFPLATPGKASDFYEREYVAEVNALKHAELRARGKGLLESVSVDEGQAVKAGQLLFTFASRGLQQDVKKARAA